MIIVLIVVAMIVRRPAILSAHPALAAPLANKTVEPAVIKNAAICVPLIVARPVKALVEQCVHPHAVLPVKMLAARPAGRIAQVLVLALNNHLAVDTIVDQDVRAVVAVAVLVVDHIAQVGLVQEAALVIVPGNPVLVGVKVVVKVYVKIIVVINAAIPARQPVPMDVKVSAAILVRLLATILARLAAARPAKKPAAVVVTVNVAGIVR